MTRQAISYISLLRYLNEMSEARRTATIGDVAQRFGLDEQKATRILLELSSIEVGAGYDGYTFTLDFGQNDIEDDDETSPVVPVERIPLDTEIVFTPSTGTPFGELRLTLAEIVTLLLLIDDLLEVTAPGQDRDSLKEVRQRLTEAAEAKGYPNLMWRSDDALIAPATLALLTRAIDERLFVDLSYSHLDVEALPGRVRERVTQRQVLPIRLEGGARPLLKTAYRDGSRWKLRTYRIDRIGSVRLGQKATGYASALKAVREDTRRNEKEPAFRTSGAHEATLRITHRAMWVTEQFPEAGWEEAGEAIEGTLAFRSYDFLLPLLLQIGTDLIDIGPEEVRRTVAAAFRTLEEDYE